jgi:hypothetical protein
MVGELFQPGADCLPRDPVYLLLSARQISSKENTMSPSLFDLSVSSYLQTLGGVSNVLEKGEQYAADSGIDLDEMVNYRLRDDMAPFSFQVISVWHHSLNAVTGLKEGLFQPPPKMDAMDYAALKGLVADAITGLEGESREAIDALVDKPMLFKMGDIELPFTATNFILSFSLPNFYFHATTTYDILRLQGVPLGKMDYLGALRMGH